MYRFKFTYAKHEWVDGALVTVTADTLAEAEAKVAAILDHPKKKQLELDSVEQVVS